MCLGDAVLLVANICDHVDVVWLLFVTGFASTYVLT